MCALGYEASPWCHRVSGFMAKLMRGAYVVTAMSKTPRLGRAKSYFAQDDGGRDSRKLGPCAKHRVSSAPEDLGSGVQPRDPQAGLNQGQALRR